MGNNTIFTVGHSNHELEYFADILQSFGINSVVDVRSVPASSRYPQFNKSELSDFLKKRGVGYLHFGKEFGARQNNHALLTEDGKVDFEKVRQTEGFQRGIERLRDGVEKGYTIALMCSEAEPFDCHRFSMISVFLEKIGFDVRHILKDKTVKTNTQLENQLLKKYNHQLPIATDIDEQISYAYQLRNREIAFSPYSAEFIEQV